MKLTGYCLDAFRERYDNSTEQYLLNNIPFDDLPLVCQNALIVDWFDSVGIRIGIDPYYDMQGTYRANIEHCGFQSMYRNTAIGMAIEKANETFNLNNK